MPGPRVLHIPYVLSGRRQMSQLPHHPLPLTTAVSLPASVGCRAELKIILKNKIHKHVRTCVCVCVAINMNFTLKLFKIKRELHAYEYSVIYLKIQLKQDEEASEIRPDK